MVEAGNEGTAAPQLAVDRETQRLIAWNRELTDTHRRLRDAVQRARDAVHTGDLRSARADLRLHCNGFCTALTNHHVAEDVALFPELAARYPELRRTITILEEDHERIASLLGQFDEAIASDTPAAGLALHLDGLAAIMESHFRYEERRLLDTLATLDLDADPRRILGSV